MSLTHLNPAGPHTNPAFSQGVPAAEVGGQHPTASTVLQVSGFARPEVLVELAALAVVP